MPEGDSHLPSELLLAAGLLLAPLAFGATENWSRALVAGVVWTALMLRGRAVPFPSWRSQTPMPLFWAVAALLAFALIQLSNEVSPLTLGLAKGPFTSSRAATFEWVLDWSLYAAVLLLVPSFFKTEGAAERLAWLLLSSGALIALVGVAQQQAGNEYYYGLRKVSNYRMPFGPFPNKNHAGAYLAMCALVGGGLAATVLERFRSLRQGGRQDEFFGRLVVILALEFLVLVGLFRARSRGAVVACVGAGAISIALYAFSARRVGRAAAFAFLLAAAALVAGVSRYAGTKYSSYIPAVGESSLSFRYAMVADGLKIISAFPLGGVGLGAIRAVYPLWMDPVMKGYYTDHLHCDPVELAAECGVPLALLFYLAFLATLALAAKALGKDPTPPTPLVLAFVGAGAAILTHQVLEFPSHIMSVQLTAVVCLAAAWGQGTPSSRRPRETPGTGPALRWLAVLAVMGAWGVIAAPRLTAAYFDLLASRYPQPSKQYFLVQAHRFDPTVERAIGVAASNWQLAIDNPAAAAILLRSALKSSSEALAWEPLHPEARRLHAGIFASLGRLADEGEVR